ncbi:uncharacterized protein PAC_11582 [Phialocephala subalpina]|uniref:Uncharacterized protein n=1 Tax=Phialocephala subalpina TaxID=576137 RepID=A0A1L7X9H9_9HELO|nr:uncharacterized protein PAC_11582 [Phialocephala subalpina]
MASNSQSDCPRHAEHQLAYSSRPQITDIESGVLPRRHAYRRQSPGTLGRRSVNSSKEESLTQGSLNPLPVQIGKQSRTWTPLASIQPTTSVQQPAERGRSGLRRQSIATRPLQNMTGGASGSQQKLWANGAPLNSPQQDQGGPSEARGGWTSSQDPQPSEKGKELEKPTTSDEVSMDRNDSSSESTDHSDEPASTVQEASPELSPRSNWEITGNDGTGGSHQQQIEKLKADLNKERVRRAWLEDDIAQLETDAKNAKEERRRWESKSITRLTPADLLDNRDEEWQQIFNNLTKRYQESVDMKHSLEDQLEEANKTIKRLERQIEKLNKRLEISQKEVGRLNAELHQRTAQTEDSEGVGLQNGQQSQDRRSPSPAQEEKGLSTSSQENDQLAPNSTSIVASPERNRSRKSRSNRSSKSSKSASTLSKDVKAGKVRGYIREKGAGGWWKSDQYEFVKV